MNRLIPSRRLRCLLALLVFWATLPRTISAAGLRHLEDGWLLAPAEVVALLQSTPARPTSTGLWATTGGMRLYEMPDLPVALVRIGGSHRIGGLRWHWTGMRERTGADLLREDWTTVTLCTGNRTHAGLEVSLRELTIGGVREAHQQEFAVLLARAFDLGDRVHCRFEGRFRLTSMTPWLGAHSRQPLVAATAVFPAIAVGFGVAVDRRGDGTPGVSVDLTLGLDRRFGLGLRADPPTGALGPLLVCRAGGLLLRTSHLVHPELGPTHRVGLTVGRLEAVWR